MIKVDQKTIAEYLKTTTATIIAWEKRDVDPIPVIREPDRKPYYNLKKCLIWKHGEKDGLYFYRSYCECDSEED